MLYLAVSRANDGTKLTSLPFALHGWPLLSRSEDNEANLTAAELNRLIEANLWYQDADSGLPLSEYDMLGLGVGISTMPGVRYLHNSALQPLVRAVLDPPHSILGGGVVY